jgi:hypothetical protein
MFLDMEGDEFEIRMLKFTLFFNRIPNAQNCDSAPLLANPCWWYVLFDFSLNYDLEF